MGRGNKNKGFKKKINIDDAEVIQPQAEEVVEEVVQPEVEEVVEEQEVDVQPEVEEEKVEEVVEEPEPEAEPGLDLKDKVKPILDAYRVNDGVRVSTYQRMLLEAITKFLKDGVPFSDIKKAVIDSGLPPILYGGNAADWNAKDADSLSAYNLIMALVSHDESSNIKLSNGAIYESCRGRYEPLAQYLL